MSYTSTGPNQFLDKEAHGKRALSLLFFLCAAVALLLRFTVSPQILNLVVNYTADQGSFYEKLHVGTYAIFMLLAVVVFSRPIVLRGDEITLSRTLIRYAALMFALVPYLFLMGRAGSSGFIIDTYVVAGAAGLLMLLLDPGSRRALGDVVLCMLIISALIGIVEAVTQQRFLPYDLVELQFRPIGLSAHPLALGAFSATAIGFVTLTRWPIWVRVAAILLLFVGCAASGARFSLLCACAEILVLLLFVRWPHLSPRQELKAKMVALIFASILGLVLIAVLFSGGLLNRFGNTIFDENFMARVTIYQVFDYVGWKEILIGMSDKDLLAIVRGKLHLPNIESAPVVVTMLFGLPLALYFALVMFWMLFRMLRGTPLQAWIATITFLLAALSNNALSSKTPEIAMIVVLLLAYRPTRPTPQRTGTHTG